MKKYTYIKILCACVAINISACSKQAPANNFTVLDDANCVQYESSSIKPELPDEWNAYLDSTKVCSLIRNSNEKSEIVIISVFIDEYYRSRPMDAAWERFPKPVLFNNAGQCVARLPYLYPAEPPLEMELSYGRWQNSMPLEIHIHVYNPAVSGDFDLPVLTWDSVSKQYIAIGQSIGSQQEKMRCLQ